MDIDEFLLTLSEDELDELCAELESIIRRNPMAAQATKSQLINQMKNRSRGGWAQNRQVTPQPRGQGGLPPNMKSCVGVCKSYKLDKTTTNDPFFSLTMIIKEPDDLAGRRATQFWYMNESQYQTYEEAERNLANDIALMTNDEPPEDYDGILEVFKNLCESGRHLLFNTGGPRNNGKPPYVYVQGPADGWQDEPQEGAGEDTRPTRAAQQATRSQQNPNGQPPRAAAPNRGPAQPQRQPEPEPEPEPEPQAEGDQVEPEPEPEPYIPKKGDKYGYTYRGKKIDFKVESCDKEAETVALKELKPAKGKQPLVFKKIPFSKLELASEE